ncbi:MAG: C25 family cysteine peptidase, partial [Lentisphaerota bacterium]
MRISKVILISLLLLLGTTIRPSPAQTDDQQVRRDEQSYVLDLPAFELVETGLWTEIQSASHKFFPLSPAGYPSLPGLRQLIEMPQGVRILRVVFSPEIQSYSLALPLGPESLSVPYGQPVPPLDPNERAYATREPYPERKPQWQLVHKGHRDLLEVVTQPFQYIALSRELLVAHQTRLVIELEYPEPRTEARPWTAIDHQVTDMIENPERHFARTPATETSRNEQALIEPDPDYLIFAPCAWTSSLSAFVAAKNSAGFQTQVYDVGNIYSNSIYGEGHESIWHFIQAAHSNWSSTYVLLVGYPNHVPTGPGANNDNYYGLLDGPEDRYQDVYVGRMPAINTAEVAAISRKWADYDSRGWARQQLGLTGEDMPCIATNDFQYYSWPTTNLFGSNVYDTALSCSDINDAMNGQHGLITWCGHGNRSFWVVENSDFPGDGQVCNFDSMNAANRTNPCLPFVNAMVSCDAGQFGDYNDIAGRFVRSAQGGAIGYIGANALVWLDGNEDDTYIKRWFEDRLRDAYLHTGFAQPGRIFHNILDGDIRRLTLYNLMGDPSAQMDFRPSYMDLKAPWISNITWSSAAIVEGQSVTLRVVAYDGDQLGNVKAVFSCAEGHQFTNELVFNRASNDFSITIQDDITGTTGSTLEVSVSAWDISRNKGTRTGDPLVILRDDIAPSISRVQFTPSPVYQPEPVTIRVTATDETALASTSLQVVD